MNKYIYICHKCNTKVIKDEIGLPLDWKKETIESSIGYKSLFKSVIPIYEIIVCSTCS